jgi:putative inorganic carbon (hco3(-)) transporter
MLGLALLAMLLANIPLDWLIFALVALTAGLVSLIYPWLAWIALAVALPVTSGLRIGPASATDALLFAALALWAASAIALHYVKRVVRIPIWPIAVYIFTLYLSTLGALDLDEALTEMVKWVEFGVVLWVVPRALPDNRATWLVAALLLAAALQGLYGLYQFIFRIGPDWFLIQGRFMRASGVFGQPNPYGAFLGLSLPVAFSLTLWSLLTLMRQRTWAMLIWTAFYGVVAGCIAVGLIASWSRGAWLGALASTAIVLALFDKRTALALAVGALLLSMAALLGALNPSWIPAAISARVGDLPAYFGLVDVLTLEVNDDNFAVIERVAHWVAALRMWESALWLGVGPGNYATVYTSVALARWSDSLGHAHNIYLNVLGESGILGLAAFLFMWSSLVVWLVRIKRTSLPPQSWAYALAVGALGVLAHLAVHSFFDNLFVQGMYLHVALWLAAVAVAVSPHYHLYFAKRI